MELIQRIIFLLLVVVLVGCAAPEPPEFQYQDEDVSEKEFIKEGRTSEPVQRESTLPPTPEPEALPKEGKIIFNSNAEEILQVLDTSANVKMNSEGDLSYKIDKQGLVKGNGKGELKVELSSDIGIAKCEGSETIPLEFSVTGMYAEKVDEIAFLSHDIKPKSITIVLDCPNDFGQDLTYELETPVLFFGGSENEGKVTLKLDESEISKKITHKVPDWDVDIEADWNFKLDASEEFDFDVDVDPPAVSVAQGDVAKVQVNVRLLKGTAKLVDLTVTDWPGLVTNIANSFVTPSEVTTLTVETDCNTVPDTYLFTVRGEAKDTFKTSVDSVNIEVTKNSSC